MPQWTDHSSDAYPRLASQLKTITPLNYNTIQHPIKLLHFHRPRVQDSKRKVNKTAQWKRTQVHEYVMEDPFPLPTGKTLALKIASPVEQLFTRHWPIEEMLNCVEGAKFSWWTGFLSFVQQTLVWRHFLAASSWNCPRVYWADINLGKLWFYDGAYDGESGKLRLKTNFQ